MDGNILYIFDKNCIETSGFTRQDWWHSVGREAKMLRNSVGVIDISNFAKYSCKGPGAEKWLNSVFANKMPSRNWPILFNPIN